MREKLANLLAVSWITTEIKIVLSLSIVLCLLFPLVVPSCRPLYPNRDKGCDGQLQTMARGLGSRNESDLLHLQYFSSIEIHVKCFDLNLITSSIIYSTGSQVLPPGHTLFRVPFP